MNKGEPTHVYIKGNSLVISPNISSIFDFLIKIDSEILSVLEFNKKLDVIKIDISEILKLTSHLSKIIQDNNLDLNYEIDNNILKIGEKFNFLIPTRAEFIILFSYLEVLFSVYISFEKEIDDKELIRKEVMNSEETRKFISKFILNINNDYFNKNSKKLGGITSVQLRDLRNSLTHFYSLGDSLIVLVNDNSNTENKKITNDFKSVGLKNIYPLSSFDLYKLLSGVFGILIQNMNGLYLKDKLILLKI